MKHIQVHRFIFIFLLGASGLSVCGQDSTKQLGLREAVDMAIKNSKQLKAGRAKIDEAIADLQVAKDQRLPDVKISGAYLRLNNPNISLANKSSSSSGSSTTSDTKVSSATYGMANISYPVYAGLRIKNGINAAEYLEQAVKLDVDNDKEGIALNAINAFINLYKAKAAVILVRENLQQSRQRDQDLSGLEKNGLLARNDLLKANLQTSNIELSLADAESNAKLATITMDILLGLPENTQIIPDTTTVQTPPSPASIMDYEQMAIQNRKDVQALALRRKAATTGIDIAKADIYPSLGLSGGYIAADIPGFLTVTNAVNISIGVNYSLSSLWKTKAKIQQATAKQQQVIAGQEVLDDNVRLDVNQAYQAYLLSKKKIDVYNKAIEQAIENYRITKNKYDNTLATTTELLDADVAQLQAKLNYSFAKADALVAYNKLLQVSGQLPITTTP